MAQTKDHSTRRIGNIRYHCFDLIIVTHYNSNASSSLLRFHFIWFYVIRPLSVTKTSFPCGVLQLLLLLFWQLIAVIALYVERSSVVVYCFAILIWGMAMKNCFWAFYKRIHCLLAWHLCRYKSFRFRKRELTLSIGKNVLCLCHTVEKCHVHFLSSSITFRLFDLFRHFGLTIAFVFDCWFCYVTKPIFNNRPNTGNNIIRLMTFVNKTLSPGMYICGIKDTHTKYESMMGSWKTHKNPSICRFVYLAMNYYFWTNNTMKNYWTKGLHFHLKTTITKNTIYTEKHVHFSRCSSFQVIFI